MTPLRSIKSPWPVSENEAEGGRIEGERKKDIGGDGERERKKVRESILCRDREPRE